MDGADPVSDSIRSRVDRGGIAEGVVARIPGVVLSVDEDLHVLAWSREVQDDLALPTAKIQGRRCYELVSAIDAETGRACSESCPLARGSGRPGWAFSRILDVDGLEAGRARLDCLQLRYVTPNGKRANLCFLGPSHASQTEAHSRVLNAIEALYPMVSGLAADPGDVLAVSLKAVLHTASADGGEVFLLDTETHELVLRESQGLSTETMKEFRRSVVGDRFPDVVAQSQLPLLAVGTWPDDGSDKRRGTYLCAPLVAEGRVLGALAVASQRQDFDVALATRILFPVAAQLGVYLRWAYLASDTRATIDRELAPAGAPRLRIRCLGPFRVELDRRPVPVTQFQRFKALTLLKFLVAHRGRPVPRETLMELLWPEVDPVRARGNLRVVLHALRRGLEPDLRSEEASSFVVSQGDLVYLEPSSHIWVDAEELVRRARRAAKAVSEDRIDEAISECQHAAELYQGEYLEDEPYSDWCLFERERLREVYINLRKQMGSSLAQRGRAAEAVEAYRAALDVDRGREDVHRELMLLLWKAGRRDEALRQYYACRRILGEELEAEPTQETEAVYKAMLDRHHP